MFSKSKYLFHLTRNVKFDFSATARNSQWFHSESKNKEPVNQNKAVTGTFKEKYIIYKDEDAIEIFDIDEQKKNDTIELAETQTLKLDDINLKRGLNGVYEIDELVDLLEKEGAENVFVCPIDKKLNYVDFMCIVTGRSYRHMLAIAQYIRKVFKMKCGPNDILPKIEGEECEKWMAMDLGNIALHILSEEAREKYDLETLWTLGPEFDKELQKPQDDIMNLYQQHSVYLDQSNKNDN